MGRLIFKGKKRGSILIEVMIGLLIFSVGLLALSSAMMLALRGIKESGDRLAPRQETVNRAMRYIARRSYEHDNSASNSGASKLSGSYTLTLRPGTADSISIYKFTPGAGDSYSIYVAEGGN